MRVKLINRTPHPITIQTIEGEIVEIPPTPPPVRLAERVIKESVWEMELPNGRVVRVKVVEKELIPNGTCSSLTDEKFTADIVSLPAALAGGGLVPDTGSGAVRDEKGNILYVTQLAIIKPIAQRT